MKKPDSFNNVANLTAVIQARKGKTRLTTVLHSNRNVGLSCCKLRSICIIKIIFKIGLPKKELINS